MSSNSHWKDRVLDKTLPGDSNNLTATCRSVFSILMKEESIDLGALVPEQVNAIHLCMVLRATCTNKRMAPGWHEAFKVAISACELEGINLDDALFGMFNEPPADS